MKFNNKIAPQTLAVLSLRFLLAASLILVLAFALGQMNRPPVKAVHEAPKRMDVAALQSFNHTALLNNTATPAITGRRKKVESLIHPIILKAASRHQLDPALIKAIIMAESGYKIKAISKSGAKGLMQLMPGTAEALGITDIFNPKENISGGVRYFKQLVKQLDGNIKLALAAYNAGISKVRYYNGIPPYKATQYYIKKVFKYYNLYKNETGEKIDKA